jgi:hypothetical protein
MRFGGCSRCVNSAHEHAHRRRLGC